MSRQAVVQSHLEVLMLEHLGVQELKVSAEGEINVQADEVSYTARLRTDREDPHVEVYSVVLTEVEADPGLYEALNDINRGLAHSRIFWVPEQIVVSGELVGAASEEQGLACLCEEVARVANHCGPELSAVYGGKAHRDRGEDR